MTQITLDLAYAQARAHYRNKCFFYARELGTQYAWSTWQYRAMRLAMRYMRVWYGVDDSAHYCPVCTRIVERNRAIDDSGFVYDICTCCGQELAA